MRALHRSLVSFIVFLTIGTMSAERGAKAEEATAASLATAAREQLFEDLAADVADLERQGSILKRVVKLAKPSVVHIEAQRDAEPGHPLREIDEAGSGVIVEREGRHYVLTNRHVIKYSSLTNIDVRLVDGR